MVSEIGRLNTHISQVTVYADRARVTRRGIVALTGTERELIITGLPVILQTETVRATGSGTVPVRLQQVRSERIFATEPVRERVAQLSEQIQHLEEQLRRIQNQIMSIQIQNDFVQGLAKRSVDRFSRVIVQQQASLNEIREFLNFIGQQNNDLSSAIQAREKEQHQLERQILALRQQLEQMQTPASQESFSILVSIEPAGAGNFELEVSYVVNRASWTPLYDLRVDTIENSLNLSYLAEVRQSTGEDWIGVALTLSTAKLGLGTLPPKLAPWYIDNSYDRPEFSTRRRPQMAQSKVEEYADYEAEINDSAPEIVPMPPPIVQAESVAAVVSTSGGAVTFETGGNGNIPSDGNPHKITIFNDNYPCSKEYVAIPRSVSFAYLEAKVINPGNGVTLLPGKANIFRDRTFVGTTKLENVSPGQEFKVNLGIDEGLKIERDLVERKVDKKLISNQRRTTYAYRLKITNLQAQEASLKLTEQLPVSRNEQIKVNLHQTNPKIQLGEMGVLEWSVTLPPQSKQELYYQFTVEHPSHFTVVGLDI